MTPCDHCAENAGHLAALSALYGMEADGIDRAGGRTPSYTDSPVRVALSAEVARAKSEAYAHAAEAVSGANEHEVARWVAAARADMEAVAAASTVGRDDA